MKFRLLSLSLLSVSAISPFLVPSLTLKAQALGCVATSVGVQVDISGSRTGGRQTNNASQKFGENCVGNSSTNTSTQVHKGANSANQTRTSNQQLGSGRLGRPGVGDVRTNIHIPVKVYNPAADRNFMKNVPGR
jgi:hypothetical protein